jgi:AcrR family transcriptional regulator
MDKDKQTQTRRRGAALDEAIYDAVISIMEEDGYAALTFQNIAKRAATSRSVLYRQWNTPFELLHAAVMDRVAKTNAYEVISEKTYDTGSLRGDLLGLCSDFAVHASMRYMRLLIQAAYAQMSRDDTGILELMGANVKGNLAVMGRIIKSAQERGEITHEPGERARLLPFEMVRYQVVFLHRNIDKSDIEAMVDEILIPVLTA